MEKRSIDSTPNGLFNASLCSFTTYQNTTKKKKMVSDEKKI